MAAEPHYFNVVLGPPASPCEALRAGEADPSMPLERDVDLTIRHAQPGDAAVLAQLMCELGYETKPTEMETRLKSILSNPAYKTFVAVMDGRVCGMIGTLAYSSYEHDDPSGRILALVTLTASRRRGIGRALIATAEKDFVQRAV